MGDLQELIARQGVMAFNSGYETAMRQMLATPKDREDWDALVRMPEEAWNEIQSAYLLKRALLTLINQYKAEGYLAATLDKIAMLIENGNDGWNYGEDQE